MNILFIFSRHSLDPNDSTLTKDLADTFAKSGANVYVMTMLEERYNRPSQMQLENGYNVLRVKTGNYFNCKNKVEKVKTILTMPTQFVNDAKKYLKDVKIDLIITHTPFVSNRRIIVPLKKFFNCPAHLILWDIFPQNAWDIGIIKNKLIFNLLKHNEIKMLKSYEQIWCMSDGNLEYIRQNYPQLSNISMNRLYNSAIIKPIPEVDRLQVREKFGYSANDVIAIFGGNMGTPQRLDNILELARRAKNYSSHAKFLFVGNGTETAHLIAEAKRLDLSNVRFIDQLPRDDYENITIAADIGIVSLDQRFTVPNFPSKTTDYFKLQLPILASLDSCSTNDYGNFLTNISQAGMFAQAGNHDELFKCYLELYSNANLRNKLGTNGRQFYEKELDTKTAYDTIIKKYYALRSTRNEDRTHHIVDYSIPNI